LPAVSAQYEPERGAKPHRIARGVVGCRHDYSDVRCFALSKSKRAVTWWR
jgi:hypothetical protein